MGSRITRLALLLGGSGFCALVYQTAWLRDLRLVFGMSTPASAAVLAIFMGGLGLGGYLVGPRADRHPSPLALYAKLELFVATTAALTPLLVGLVRWLYVALGGTTAMGPVLGTIVRLVLSALVLGAPTLAMGATLPVMARAAETADDVGRRRVAVLYGVNTLGAVVGAALASFVLLEILGVHRLLWAAAAVNLLVAAAAFAMARREDLPSGGGGPVAPTVAAYAPAAPRAFVLVAAALVGAAFLLMELVWYRMLTPILGGSLYTFGLILAFALAGIGLGSAAYALLRRDRPATLGGFALTCALEALFLALPLALGDRVAVFALLLRPLGATGFFGLVLGWGAVAAFVVLPAAFVSGVQFPLLVGLLGRGRDDVGRDAGRAYAANTAGAILGSLLGGFGALPWLTAPGAWRLVVAVLAVLAVVAAVLTLRRRAASPVPVVAAVAAVLAVLLLFARGPTAVWRHTPIGAGRVAAAPTSINALREWEAARRRNLASEVDGVESSVAMTTEDGLAFVVNGKSDGNARGDAATQVMGGLVGALLHPAPRTALVIGLGTGSTAGWLAAVPSIERVDVVELEPAILEVARASAPVNRDVLSNPKVNVMIGDAREVLLTSRARYDIVFSEPSNPYRAGIANLFTTEFYEAVTTRLADGGLFLQWVQTYEVDAATVRTVYATLGGVFPEVETWRLKGGDRLLVAGMAPVAWDVPTLRRRVAESPFREGLLAAWRATDLEGVLAHFEARASLAKAIVAADEARSTDDLPLVEFGFARSVGVRGLFDPQELRDVARARGEDRPALVGGSVDWERVADEAVAAQVADDASPVAPGPLAPDAERRLAALAAFEKGDLARTLAAWRAQPRAPRGPVELAALGEALAEAGDEEAARHATALAAFVPVEAELVRGRLHLRRGRLGEAAAALERAFVGLRSDPWALGPMVRRSFALAAEVAHRDVVLGGRLYEVLDRPFAVAVAESQRRIGLVALASVLDEGTTCAAAISALEPDVPWREAFLALRYRCYTAVGHPLRDAARADLAEFFAHEPTRFGGGLLVEP